MLGPITLLCLYFLPNRPDIGYYYYLQKLEKKYCKATMNLNSGLKGKNCRNVNFSADLEKFIKYLRFNLIYAFLCLFRSVILIYLAYYSKHYL